MKLFDFRVVEKKFLEVKEPKGEPKLKRKNTATMYKKKLKLIIESKASQLGGRKYN